MPKIQCNVCDFTPYNPTLWARQNQWFRKHSSLAGALGTQDTQASSNALKLGLFGSHNRHPQYQTRPQQLVTPGNNPPQPSVRPTVQQIPSGVQVAPNNDNQQYWRARHFYFSEVPYPPSLKREIEDAHAYARGGHKDLTPIQNPAVSQVGSRQYWQQDTQTKRHINGRSQAARGFGCPNRTGTCPNFQGYFASVEAVKNHCRTYPACNATLQCNNGKIPCWGMTATELDFLGHARPQPSQISQHPDGRRKLQAI